MLFSATLDGEVGELARAYTRNPSRFEAEPPDGADSGEVVDHRFVPVTADGKVDALIEELEAERGLALVFVRTKRGADRLAGRLTRRDVDAVAMHGDMSQGARERALERFRSGKVTTLVATDVAARGLDLTDITHVINFDPPEDDKGYVHRVGRTGRAGRGGSGITFVLPEQQADVSRVATRLGHREQFEREGMRVGQAEARSTRAGAAAGHAGRTGSTSSVSPSRPTIRTTSPVSAPGSQRAFQISPRTRTSPSGRQALRTSTFRPSKDSTPTLAARRWDHQRPKSAVPSSHRAATVTAMTFQGEGNTNSASASAMIRVM